MGEGVGRVSFTFGDAIRLGYRHIRRELSRAVIVMASVALGIAFLATLLFTEAFYRAHARLGGSLAGVEAIQYWLVFVALAVSVVGIANAMLIAVYERYRVIGTMKCLGALDGHILMLFLTESLIQGAVGGVVGVLVGLLASLVSVALSIGLGVIPQVPAVEFLGLAGGAFVLSVSISVGATLYPAYRAARLMPVEALRYEL